MDKKSMKKTEIAFLIVVGVVFSALASVFLFLPRSEYSELERRELAKFPVFSVERLKDGSFTRDVSHWFSDSEPFRDRFMSFHISFKDYMAYRRDEGVTFHASVSGGDPAGNGEAVEKNMVPADEREISEVTHEAIVDENAKLADAGIIITGKGENARALMVFGGSGKGESAYAATLNAYASRLSPGVKVYAMVIPTSIEFYCPEKVKQHTNSELATIRNIYSQLSDGVQPVDVYTPLAKHASEPIFLRTDHHWAPLGAFYAAERFAKVAGVPFAPLSSYNRKVVRDFVGTMYGYSKDKSIKNAPEDFVYYTPKDTVYTTTIIDFDLDKDFKIVKEYPARKGKFFYKYKDGSGSAYSTFMGGDRKIVKVKTHVGNGRRLVIIKDSFGNALPGYFFSSFDEVHVVDFRYFNRDLRTYLKENNITDVVIALNVFNAYSKGVAKKISDLLH